MTSAEALKQAGERHASGDLAGAKALYGQALAADPACSQAIFLLGIVEMQEGRLLAALERIQQSIALAPTVTRYWYGCGEVLSQLRRFPEAASAYRRVLAAEPKLAEASNALGVALQSIGDPAGASAAFLDALRHNPQYGNDPVWAVNIGVAFCDQRLYADAVMALERAATLNPAMPEAFFNLGNALSGLGKRAEAIAQYRKAVALNPSYADAYNNLGTALRFAGDSAGAIEAFEEARRADPAGTAASNNLAGLYRSARRLDDAERELRSALAVAPNSAQTLNNFGNVIKEQGDMPAAIECFRRVVALAPSDSVAHGNLVYSLTFTAEDGRPVLNEARRWNAIYAAPLLPRELKFGNARTARRLRVGYVAGDFRDHCQSLFTIPLLEHHDHAAVEVYGYSSVQRPDALTQRIEGLTDVWRDVRFFDDEALARLIREDQIDILVDLELQMSNGRPLLFARKPAPIQVGWLAYPATTGMSAIDAVFTDPRLVPPGLESDYTEQVVRLPDTFWCYDPLATEPDVNALPALAAGFVTFGCLNAPYKITDHTLRLWGEVMRRLPTSRLVVLGPTGTHRETFLARFSAVGIDPSQVTIQSFLQRPEYLKSYHQIDLALDTFPYNGHTTSLDAFWMGVPVVSRVGSAAVGRAGLSQLHNLGFTDLASGSDEGFVDIAVNLASDLPRLSGLRSSLRSRMEKSPLMDGARFARNVEDAYRRLWRDWCAS
ncbi:MAG TPA: tetratricopeptide repeat protein [Opitutaceae bacterium]|jgi:predicted O-linked N-acetylglucosamine transferase (SPINDLY family)